MATHSELRRRFRSFSGRDGVIAFAPGRVNLIGEHTDYTGGFVLPASLALLTYAVAGPRDDTIIRVFSEERDEVATFRLDVEPAQERGQWSDYVAGVAWALQRAGQRLCGADLLISSEVPIGYGLSSSAALEVSVAYALLTVADLEMPRLAIAKACHSAESQYVGARCGVMDQFIATHGRRGYAVLLDCGSLAWRAVPLPATHRWIVANTMVRHAHAGGEYNIRRAECDEVVSVVRRRLPHRERLAELSAPEVERLARELSPTTARRLRHIAGENQRVQAAVDALETGSIARLGQLLNASHASLRDDFEVSCPELDAMVDIALQLPGVVGARMIGGGFGGCALALVEAAQAHSAMGHLRMKYAEAVGVEPVVFECEFGDAGGALA